MIPFVYEVEKIGLIGSESFLSSIIRKKWKQKM